MSYRSSIETDLAFIATEVGRANLGSNNDLAVLNMLQQQVQLLQQQVQLLQQENNQLRSQLKSTKKSAGSRGFTLDELMPDELREPKKTLEDKDRAIDDLTRKVEALTRKVADLGPQAAWNIVTVDRDYADPINSVVIDAEDDNSAVLIFFRKFPEEALRFLTKVNANRPKYPDNYLSCWKRSDEEYDKYESDVLKALDKYVKQGFGTLASDYT